MSSGVQITLIICITIVVSLYLLVSIADDKNSNDTDDKENTRKKS